MKESNFALNIEESVILFHDGKFCQGQVTKHLPGGLVIRYGQNGQKCTFCIFENFLEESDLASYFWDELVGKGKSHRLAEALNISVFFKNSPETREICFEFIEALQKRIYQTYQTLGELTRITSPYLDPRWLDDEIFNKSQEISWLSEKLAICTLAYYQTFKDLRELINPSLTS